MSIPLKTENSNYHIISHMNKKLFNSDFNFDEYRRWFNRSYKLELNGKFIGLSGLVRRCGERVLALFVRSLRRSLAKFEYGSCDLFILGIQTFCISGYSLRVRLW